MSPNHISFLNSMKPYLLFIAKYGPKLARNGLDESIIFVDSYINTQRSRSISDWAQVLLEDQVCLP